MSTCIWTPREWILDCVAIYSGFKIEASCKTRHSMDSPASCKTRQNIQSSASQRSCKLPNHCFKSLASWKRFCDGSGTNLNSKTTSQRGALRVPESSQDIFLQAWAPRKAPENQCWSPFGRLGNGFWIVFGSYLGSKIKSKECL